MKKLLRNLWIAAIIAAGAAVAVSCNKNDGKDGPSGGIYKNFAGEYTLSTTSPFILNLTAADPAALVIEGDPSGTTYGDLTGIVQGLMAGIKLDAEDVAAVRMCFTAEGTVFVKTHFSEKHGWMSSMDENADPQLYGTYTLSGGNMNIVIPKELTAGILEELSNDEAAMTGAMLSYFNKGVVTYIEGVFAANLRYTEAYGKLSVYVDKTLLFETIECANKMFTFLKTMVGPQNPDLAESLAEIEPFLNLAVSGINGFTKIEAGVNLEKQPDIAE